MTETVESILWRSIPWPGHESARLVREAGAWILEGGAAFAQDGQPCVLRYSIGCGDDWLTRYARVEGWIDEQAVRVEIEVTPERIWRLNGQTCDAVAGCIDVDLNFSPSTNLLPIRRLGLQVGEKAMVRAAWLRFPGFSLEPLEQEYLRTGADTYVYCNPASGFTAELKVSGSGFVLDYQNIWTAARGGLL